MSVNIVKLPTMKNQRISIHWIWMYKTAGLWCHLNGVSVAFCGLYPHSRCSKQDLYSPFTIHIEFWHFHLLVFAVILYSYAFQSAHARRFLRLDFLWVLKSLSMAFYYLHKCALQWPFLLPFSFHGEKDN
jgi:hypothetical protein